MQYTNVAFITIWALLFNSLIYLIRGLQLKPFKPWVTLLLFNTKFLAGVALWWVYTFYYTDTQNNDAYKFYKDALTLNAIRHEAPQEFAHLFFGYGRTDQTAVYEERLHNWERNFDEAPINENRTVIRFETVVMMVCGNIYFTHILVMCFFSLLGWVLLFNTVSRITRSSRATLYMLVSLFLPSVLFWGSGVMKEPLLILGLGLFVHGLANDEKPFKRLTAVLAGALLLLAVKFYVLVCIFPAACMYVLFKNEKGFVPLAGKYAAGIILLAVVAFALPLFTRFNLPQTLANKQEHAIKEADYFKAGSRINIPIVDARPMSIVKAAPLALWNTLTRPYPWEGRNAMMLLSALENIAVLWLLVLMLWGAKQSPATAHNLFLFLFSASITYFVVIGLCTPVAGNLVRYKAPLVPLFLFAFAVVNADHKPRAFFDFVWRKGA